MVEEKRIIVRNVARSIIYPYGEKATNIPSQKDLEKNPRLRYTFEAGEQFEIPASKLDSLKRAFPNEIVVGEGLSVNSSDAVLLQKNQEIDRLRAENEELKAENEELKEKLEKAKKRSKKSEEE